MTRRHDEEGLSPPQATRFEPVVRRVWALALVFLSIIVYTDSMNTTEAYQLEYQRDEHRVHLILYHLIWCPKRRKPILVGNVKERCQQLLEQKCEVKGWHVISWAIQPDHVHLCVRVWPTESAADVVKELKGATSFSLRQEFKPLLSKLPSLWTRSYFAATVGSVSEDGIKAYIQAQKGV